MREVAFFIASVTGASQARAEPGRRVCCEELDLRGGLPNSSVCLDEYFAMDVHHQKWYMSQAHTHLHARDTRSGHAQAHVEREVCVHAVSRTDLIRQLHT